MNFSNLGVRLRSRYVRTMAANFYRRPVEMRNKVPLISFSFDDFPRSALTVAGEILKRHGVAGTYYASLGLMGQRADAGKMFEQRDLAVLLEQGHELGCHTFHHLNAWETPPAVFEDSVAQNRHALEEILPGGSFRSLSYPKSVPRPSTKRRVGHLFACCRCGGQTFNSHIADASYLSAFFLEKTRDHFESIKKVIALNAAAGGWLIFATHDVCERPSPYGCTPKFFEEVVKASIHSGAQVFPVVKAWETLSCNGS